MSALSDRVAKLEAAGAAGKAQGRDLEVILRQVERAEDKIRKATQSSPARRTFLPD